ncbi:FAD-dependent oxidoreductase [Micrococcus sp.]|uniref:FAD-dependent oxidoreductase n=1 Tax=Micrococcus sp. TaxID=1271 RepID=UPI0026DBEFFA|nr:FAD/NAD(P)-binding oxidoreductase [Micrococcus sp.]MDO4238800.1 FAD/NAD(P)-binding oxidoreductase [Micrococcus sp.]
MTEQYDILIVGGGNAGISLAAKLARDGAGRIGVADGTQLHRYRPMLNYAAGGQADMAAFERPMRAVIPEGVEWIPDHVVAVDPEERTAVTFTGLSVGFRHLVLCPGLYPWWGAIDGLREAYGAGWAASAHVPEYVDSARKLLAGVTAGDRVVANVPAEPSSCGGTVLKALFLACAAWEKAGILGDVDVHLVTPYARILDRHTIDDALAEAAAAYGIHVHAGAEVNAVDHAAREVVLSTGERIDDVAAAYITPVVRAPEFITEAGLEDGGAAGLVAVDPETMRHRLYPHVWALGDAAALDTRPSGGALRRQVKVLAQNIQAADAGKPLQTYDGYTVIPVMVGRDELVLDEHVRDGSEDRSIPGVDVTKPRKSTAAFDRFGQPRIYWQRLLKGKV